MFSLSSTIVIGPLVDFLGSGVSSGLDRSRFSFKTVLSLFCEWMFKSLNFRSIDSRDETKFSINPPKNLKIESEDRNRPPSRIPAIFYSVKKLTLELFLAENMFSEATNRVRMSARMPRARAHLKKIVRASVLGYEILYERSMKSIHLLSLVSV